MAVYVIVVLFRIQYPFELMWQEGASVDHVAWILSGNKYYVAPSMDFVPAIYTPLYFYSAALLSKVTGVGFFSLRIISFLSSLGCLLIIFLIVKKETGSSYYGVVSSGLFAATYHISGAWFDIGKQDSMFLVILLMAVYLIRFKTSIRSYLAAGILISLSFYTKQTALVISLPIMLFCLMTNKRLAIYFIAAILIFIGLGSFMLNNYYEGWYNYYVFELPRTTPVAPEYLVHFWLKDIGKPFFIAFLLGAFCLGHMAINKEKNKFFFYLMLSVGMFGASWYSRFRGGGYYNVLFPAYTMISILMGLGLHRLFQEVRTRNIEKRDLIVVIIYVLCIIQFVSGSLIYNPLKQIPTEKDREAGNKLVAELAEIEGEVFSSFHGYLTVMAGKKSYVNQMGMRDVVTTNSEKHALIKSGMIEDMKQAMKEQKFAAIIISSYGQWYPYDMEKYYIKKEKIFSDDDVFYPVTGLRTRPEFIYIPKEQ